MATPLYVLVDTKELLSEAISELYALDRSRPALYIDLEGYDLCRYGRISLINIYAEPLGKTFLIDVHVLGEDVFGLPVEGEPEKTLKALLEDTTILKCLWDCRNDSDALYNIYKIDMKGVIDLQLMEVATRKGRKTRVSGLGRAIEDYAELAPGELEEWKQIKEYGKSLFNDDQKAVFEERPLPAKLINYSIHDVSYLPKLWETFDVKLNPTWRKKVEEEVFWRLQLSRQDVYYGRNADGMRQSPWA